VFHSSGNNLLAAEKMGEDFGCVEVSGNGTVCRSLFLGWGGVWDRVQDGTRTTMLLNFLSYSRLISIGGRFLVESFVKYVEFFQLTACKRGVGSRIIFGGS